MLTRPVNRTLRGFTLTELLVAFAVVAVLTALTIPAVQEARESARRIQCLNQIRQLALALHDYADVFSRIPNGSWVRQLRPALEIHREARAVPAYVCPSDSQHANGDHTKGRMSFALNQWLRQPDPGTPKRFYMVPLGVVTDGLSNTAAFSERLSLPWFAPQTVDWDEYPHYWKRGLRWLNEIPPDYHSFFDACHNRADKPMRPWFLTEEYDHIMPPNDNSCHVRASRSPARAVVSIAVTAGSVHPGGINLTTLDGAARFVSESIDRSLWWSLGTPAEGDVLTEF